MKKSDTAVVIVNYKGIKDTEEAVESLKHSELPVDLILVDNGSPDQEGKRLTERYEKEARVIENPLNLGFAGGTNLGIQLALNQGYEFILLLNNDTRSDPKMVGILREHCSEDTVSAPAIYYYDRPNVLWSAGGRMYPEKGIGLSEHQGETDQGQLREHSCTFLNGCCMMLHRKTLEQTGLFDESYFMYVEDVDYSVKLLKHGVKMIVCPEAKLLHKVGSKPNQWNAFNIYYNTRNRIRMIQKNPEVFGIRAMIFTLTSRFVWLMRDLIMGRKRWRAFWWGIKDGLSGATGMCAYDLKKIE